MNLSVATAFVRLSARIGWRVRFLECKIKGKTFETQGDEAATKTPHRRDRRGRRDTQEKQRQGLDFRAKIVANCEDFYYWHCRGSGGSRGLWGLQFLTEHFRQTLRMSLIARHSLKKTSASSATSAFSGFVFALRLRKTQ